MEVITIDDSSSSEDEDIIQLQQTTAAVVVGANDSTKQRPLITPKFDDDSSSSSSSSSISSNDSIWNKGLSSSLASKTKANSNDTISTAAAGSNNKSTNNSDENDRCYITKSLEQLSLHEHNISTVQANNTNSDNSDDCSSVSSNDSIWDKVGLSTKTKKVDIEEVDRVAGREDGSIDIVVDCCSSSIGSLNGSILNDSTLNDSIPSGGQLKSSINNIPSNNSISQQDNSSVSSNDSIWDKQGGGFTSRKKKERVESYYDYYRLKHNNNNKSAAGNDNTTSTTVGMQQSGSKEADADNNKNNKSSSNTTKKVQKKLPHHLPSNATWHIVLLMDHREFGCANNFLQTVEKKINKHFGGGDIPSAEITTLASADYLFVARLISNDTKKNILDERVLDMVIERKNVADACSCLIAQSKKYKPLSFFEAQMYKLQTCGISKKIFLMEGDEDKTKSLLTGAKTKNEKERRLKRIKSLRLQLANDEFEGVTLVCTRNRYDTVKFLIHQLETFRNELDPLHLPTKTRDELKNYINDQMSSPTFVEYLRLRSIPGIGDVKAMKVIMDPNLDWDKSFMSPSSSKESKSTLDDKATFWKAPASTNVELGLQYEKVTKTKSKKKTKNKKKQVATTTAKENTKQSANVLKKTTKVQEESRRSF